MTFIWDPKRAEANLKKHRVDFREAATVFAFESSVPGPRHGMSELSMKKPNPIRADDMRPEYDFASMKGGVRGKYVRRAHQGTNIVLIQPEVAAT